MATPLPALGLALLASAALAGCSHDAATPSAPGTARAPAASSQVAAPSAPASVGAPAVRPTAEPNGAPPGTETCAELTTAISAATVMQPGIVDRIVAASATADAPVADAAHRLAAAYAAAITAKGTAREPDAVAAVSAAAADMDGVCNESGLESSG